MNKREIEKVFGKGNSSEGQLSGPVENLNEVGMPACNCGKRHTLQITGACACPNGQVSQIFSCSSCNRICYYIKDSKKEFFCSAEMTTKYFTDGLLCILNVKKGRCAGTGEGDKLFIKRTHKYAGKWKYLPGGIVR